MDRAVGLGCRGLGDGPEDVGVPEDVADVEPEDEVAVVRVWEVTLQFGDPSFGVHVNSIKQLEAVDEDGDLRVGLEIHGPRHLGPAGVDGVQDDADGLGVESLAELDMNPAISLPGGFAAGELQLVPEHTGGEREVPGGDLDA